ncbi:MAG: hypothetical protein ACQESA_02380 [Patescibacteria group bacterium]
MEIVTVAPLVHLPGKEELSYFTDKDIEVGSVVSVEIRSKSAPALVLKKETVSDVKSRIKTSSFGLKKINSILSQKLYSNSTLEAARETANFYNAPIGAILKSVTPKTVLENPSLSEECGDEISQSEMRPESSVLQASLKDRLVFYKQNIRGSLAKGDTILICTPTQRDAEYISEHLKKGIEHLTFTFHGGMSPKKIKEEWKRLSGKSPKLIISTGSFLSMPCGAINTLILEREASESYYVNKRPHFDITFFARVLARKKGAKFISADTVLSVRSFKECQEDERTETTPLQKRYTVGSRVSVTDMATLKDKEKNNKFYPLLSSQLLEILRERPSEHSFIYTARRGLSPITTCGDCGAIFSCSRCFSPLVLHGKTKKERVFVCHQCNKSEKTKDSCPECGSWKLTQLGVGSEKVAEFLSEAVPERKVVRLDSDNAKAKKKEESIWRDFKDTKGSILVGTEMALNRIRTGDVEIGTSAVASADSLLTYPNYSAGEKIFRNLLEIALITEKDTLIQTRVPQHRILADLRSKKVLNFLRQEMDIRQKLFYPPFSVLVIVTFSGNKNTLERKENGLADKFASYEPVFFRSISEKKRGQVVKKMLIRIKSEDWPEKTILNHLKYLPLEYKVSVNPPVIV